MARQIYELEVASDEQSITLLNGYSANIFFDRCYKRWYYDLYNMGELVAAGIALNANTAPLLGFTKEGLGLVDTGNKREEYEPFIELGQRLTLVEISE
jgi:hypothetical protein